MECLGSLASKLFQVLQVARSFELKQKLVSRAGDTFLFFFSPTNTKITTPGSVAFYANNNMTKNAGGRGGMTYFQISKDACAAQGIVLLSQNP